jgi:hypothetical protein
MFSIQHPVSAMVHEVEKCCEVRMALEKMLPSIIIPGRIASNVMQ